MSTKNHIWYLGSKEYLKWFELGYIFQWYCTRECLC